MANYDLSTFQGLILALQNYWAQQGCVILQPYDMEMGAGTFHPATFLRSIGPEPVSYTHLDVYKRQGESHLRPHPIHF